MGIIYRKFTRAPYFFKWPTFFKLSGPFAFVPMDLISRQNPGLHTPQKKWRKKLCWEGKKTLSDKEKMLVTSYCPFPTMFQKVSYTGFLLVVIVW